MKIILATIIKNLISMVLTEKIIMWGLKLAVKQTKNKIDDNIVNLVDGAYRNDVNKVQRSVEELAKIYKK